MNGFKLMAETYREELAKGEITQEEATRKCRVYDFLGTCDQDDLYNLFDSSAFNEIAKSYLRIAVRELVAEGKIDEEQGKAIQSRFRFLFDEKQAKEVCEASR